VTAHTRKPGKVRLDQLVMKLCGIEDLKVVQGLIMTRKVVVDDVVVDKPGTQVSSEAHIHLRERPLRFASRGGYKLAHALDRFRIDVRDRICLDAGACTGGFTDCLLQHGARRVYAVDAGYGQLRGKLAADSRVVNLERTNISHLAAQHLDPPIQFACADLSYLSLRKSVPIIAGLFHGTPHMVFLVKPLYEGLAQQDIATRDAIGAVFRSLLDDLQILHQVPSNACASPILGGRGAIELLIEFGGVPQSGATPDSIMSQALQDLDRNPPSELPDPSDPDCAGDR
jgi:23S rRNA (cytidine1920-2'-O)/16S rRNA (cytidine1409-2'-O)-methyltransferase